MDNGTLAAKVHIIPLSSYVNGVSFDMGGISSVATWPEYRRQGIIKNLLFHALQEMKKNGQTLSLLSPFSVPFYRKYGWELTFAQKKYEIPMSHLKRDWDGEGYVRRIEKNISLLHDIYSTYAKRFTGMLTRDEKWWKERVLTDTSQIVVAYNMDDEAEGYLIYNVKNNVCTVKEIAYTTFKSWQLLLQFIANHDSMAEQVTLTVPENDELALILDDPMFDQKTEPYFMARIVDVQAFLEQYSFEKNIHNAMLNIYVEDTFFPENSGTYKLTQSGAGTSVEKVVDGASGIQCSVQMLTVMLLGYKRPCDLYKLGLIQGNVDDIQRFEAWVPEQQTYFADFF